MNISAMKVGCAIISGLIGSATAADRSGVGAGSMQADRAVSYPADPGWLRGGGDDCDQDGVPDHLELDCDMNSVPDDCEPRGNFMNPIDAGVIGTDQEVITYSTCLSPIDWHDTEMAIWDAGGNLVAANDDTDEPCGGETLSRLDLQLPAGEYLIGITGYDMVFSDDFGVEPGPGSVCSERVTYLLTMGGALPAFATAESGKVNVIRFTIEAAPACPADLAAPFSVLNFFDISAFISLFNAGDPAADFAAPFGTLNFFDVSAYIGAYNAGCP